MKHLSPCYLVLWLALVLCGSIDPSPALAQCSGTPQTGTVCGNNTGGAALPSWTAFSAFSVAAGGTNQQIQYNNLGSLAGFTMAGDCTESIPNITCTKTNGSPFGTFATANAASPPAIGSTTPAAGTFTAITGSSITDSAITGSTQCVSANSSGTLSGLGAPCIPATDPTAGRFIPLITGTVNGVACNATTPFNCFQVCQYRGNLILINNTYVTIPIGGCVGATGGVMAVLSKTCIENSPPTPATCNTTLANGTTYYAYVQVQASVPTLVFSTTAYNVYNSTNGNAILNGDSTASLVGLLRTEAGSAAVAGDAAHQNAASWFNPVWDGLSVTGAGPFSNAGAYTALGQVTFVQWSDNVPTFAASCVFAQNSGSTATPTLGIGVSASGTPATVPSATSQVSLITGNALGLFVVNQSGAIGSEGFIIGNLLALESTTTSTGVASCTLQVPSRVPS